jgi:hypothetical protein
VSELRSKAGAEVDIIAPNQPVEPIKLRTEWLERALGLASPDGLSRWVPVNPRTQVQHSPDLWVDLTSGVELPDLPSEARLLRPRYHGGSSEAFLFDRGCPDRAAAIDIELIEKGECRVVHGGRISLPDATLVTRRLDGAFVRLGALLLEAALHLTRGKPLPARDFGPERIRGGPVNPRRYLINRYASKVGAHLRKRFVLDEAWNIGVRRRRSTAGAPNEADLDHEDFEIIPSPNGRYYADPFLIEHEGTTFLFFEDFDYVWGRGRISYMVVDRFPNLTEPEVALDCPYHLSYPFLFSYDGYVLMIPESSANGTIELYEATNFPKQWRLRSILMKDVRASDTTLLRDGEQGGWWMFTSLANGNGPSWDTLSVFSSLTLEGPWKSHPMNPVKNDVSSSRPAGRVIGTGGRLFRPAQDCSKGYGSGLSWCEIKDLTPTCFREELLSRMTCQTSSCYHGMHTYTWSSTLEAVDFMRPRSRWSEMWKLRGRCT